MRKCSLTFTAASERDNVAWFNQVSAGYFHTMQTPLLAGRDFSEADRVGAPQVAIINETMARHFYKTDNPVGRTFRYRVGVRTSEPFQISGIV